MTDSIGWGVAGAGNRASEVIIPALMDLKSSKLTGICSRDPEKARQNLLAWPDLEVYNDSSEMIANENIDAVYIATPHYLHVPIAVAAIENKKHVFMESPMALSSDGANKLVEKAKNMNVKLGVAYQYRFHPALMELKNIISSNNINDIEHININCSEPYQWRDNWWTDTNRTGPAALLRLGVHCIDLITWLKNQPVAEIMAMGKNRAEDNINTQVSILMKFEDDSHAVALASTSMREKDFSVKLTGGNFKAYASGDFSGTGETKLQTRLNGEKSEHTFGPDNPVKNMIDSFVQNIGSDEPFSPGGEDGKNIVEITCAVIESMKSKKAVQIK
jgi:predicted dehydrogenase